MKEPANPFLRDFQRKRPRMNGLAGSLPFIRSNLCTRHILKKITPRGHEDWPDKRRSVFYEDRQQCRRAKLHRGN
jgi:hypothetical protein